MPLLNLREILTLYRMNMKIKMAMANLNDLIARNYTERPIVNKNSFAMLNARGDVVGKKYLSMPSHRNTNNKYYVYKWDTNFLTSDVLHRIIVSHSLQNLFY